MMLHNIREIEAIVFWFFLIPRLYVDRARTYFKKEKWFCEMRGHTDPVGHGLESWFKNHVLIRRCSTCSFILEWQFTWKQWRGSF